MRGRSDAVSPFRGRVAGHGTLALRCPIQHNPSTSPRPLCHHGDSTFWQPRGFSRRKGHGRRRRTLLLSGRRFSGCARGRRGCGLCHTRFRGPPAGHDKNPKLALGEIAFLTVTACTDFGAFVDWDCPRNCWFRSRADQEVAVGERSPIGLYVDNTGAWRGPCGQRVAGRKQHFVPGEWVEGEAWRNDPAIGLFVIVQRRFVGLVQARTARPVARASDSFRVTHVHQTARSSCHCAGTRTRSWRPTRRRSCNCSAGQARQARGSLDPEQFALSSA